MLVLGKTWCKSADEKLKIENSMIVHPQSFYQEVIQFSSLLFQISFSDLN